MALLLPLLLLVWIRPASTLDCWVGCQGTICKQVSIAGATTTTPALVVNVDDNVPPNQLPYSCFSVCDPLGATIFGTGGPSVAASIQLIASSAAAQGVTTSVCSTSGCNNPSSVSCPFINGGGGSLYPGSTRMFGIGACTSTNGADLSSSLCQYTPIGINCPPNYYCPPYSYVDIIMYQSVLSASGCAFGPAVTAVTGNLTYAVMCPCTPGFLCPANTEIPTHCPGGFYCPPDPRAKLTPFGQPVSDIGQGAFGAIAKQCPEGTWCSEGLVVPFKCDWRIMDCPAGTQHPYTWKLVVVIVVLGILVYIPLHVRFMIAGMTRTNRRRLWEIEREKLKTILRGNLREGSALGIENIKDALPILNNIIGKKSVRELRESLGISQGEVKPSSILPVDTIPNPLVTEMQDMSPAQKPNGIDIKFEEISFKAPNGKTIMYRVSGEFKAGRMCAIMGPSGAGKSTIISLITGKAMKNAGQVTVNGDVVKGLGDHPECAKRVGFVPQEDTMLRDLSAQENIAFSARYRLPATLSKDEVENKINECIDVLELEKIKDEPVGDERTRGISGGQRKRVNVGIELVTDPRILFLDEPTSGLDSTKSKRLCRILKDVTVARNMTVAAVIHQPSKEAFEMFDDLLLLGSGGSVMYFGDLGGEHGAVAYFRSIGFTMTAGRNPAEFLLDVAQGEVEADDLPPDLDGAMAKKIFLLNTWHARRYWPREQRWNKLSPAPADPDTEARLSQLQPNSDGGALVDPQFAAIQSEILAQESMRDLILKRYHEAKDHCKLVIADAAASLDHRHWPKTLSTSAWQFYLCFKRSWRYYREERALALYAEMLMHCFSGLIVSSAGDHLKFIGPMPAPVCVIQALPLQRACFMPQDALYTQIGNFLCFGVLFSGQRQIYIISPLFSLHLLFRTHPSQTSGKQIPALQ